MYKKLILAGIVAALLAGCGDDAPEYVKTAQKNLETEMDLYVSMDLPCYRQQFEQRWFVMCFDRNSKVGPTPLFEVVKNDTHDNHYVVHPANGKASQYAEARFSVSFTNYSYDETPAEVNAWDVIELFRKAYPADS